MPLKIQLDLERRQKLPENNQIAVGQFESLICIVVMLLEAT
jgi:hypothetical protein